MTLVIVVASVTACHSKQESAALAADPRVALPVVDEAQPFDEKDAIELTVFRASGALQGSPDTHGPSLALDAWRIELESTVYEFGKKSERRLAEELMRLGKAKVTDAAKGISGRPLLLRADEEAPVEIVKHVLEAVSYGKIPRVFYVVRAGSQGAIGVVPCPLPEDVGGGSYLSVRVELMWDSGASILRRTIGPTEREHAPRVDDPTIDPRRVVIPPGRDGDAELAGLLRQRHAELELIRVRENDNALDLMIVAGPLLPWQHVVRFVHQARPTGAWRITFEN